MNKTSTLKDFEVISRLGEGSFSSVYKVRRYDDQTLYALKKVKMGQMGHTERQNALNQVRILASISHPNIVNYKQAFFDDASETLCIVMEIAESGDILKKINDHIKNKTYFKESEIWKAFIHMAKGLKVLHDMTILHRDLKCANVFVTGDNVYKLGDLNVSKVTKKSMARTHTGTPYYTSPEVWKDRPYDLKCDIWSLACVVYEMAALKPPFRANNLKELYNKIQKGIFDRIPSFYSDDLQNAITMCMKVNPVNRPTTDQLLMHPLLIKNTMPSQIYKAQPKKQCNLLKTIMVPKNLKSLKEALPASKYQIETNFEKQLMGRQQVQKKVSSRVYSVRSLGRVETPKIETPKITQSKKYLYYPNSGRPDSANYRPESANRRPESERRRDDYAKRQSPSNARLPRMPSELKNNRDHSYDYIRRDPSKQILKQRELPINRSKDFETERNKSKQIKDRIQKYMLDRNKELRRNQSQISRNVSRALQAVRKIEERSKEIITERRKAIDNGFKPRSQSFEKQNYIQARKPTALPEYRNIVDRKYMPPRQFKI